MKAKRVTYTTFDPPESAYWVVYLNGDRVSRCIEADDQAGYVIIEIPPRKSGDRFTQQRIEGKVTIDTNGMPA